MIRPDASQTQAQQGALPLTDVRARALSDDQRIAWLRLCRSENVGPVTFRDLVNRFGSAQAALDAIPDLARRGGRGRPIRIASQADAVRELKHARNIGAHIVAVGEVGYPPALAQIDAPSPLIYVKGDLSLAERQVVSIVGSRNASAAGMKFARLAAADLGRVDYVVASGLARGIDASAHMAAMETGTIAVLAGGVDVIYPPEHDALYAQIAERGLLISDQAAGLSPRARDFPRRNRIISGLAVAVLVVEAATKSGSLITARYAADQGRDVFAMPGNPLDPRAAGTNRLIKDGAGLVTSGKDIVDALQSGVGQITRLQIGGALPSGLDTFSEIEDEPPLDDIPQSDRERVVEALGHTPIEIDELVRATGLPIQVIKVALLELGLAGKIEHHHGQMISLMPDDEE